MINYINTSYKELKRVFSEFETDNFDDYKCQCQFNVITPFGVIEIYDWKQGIKYQGEDEGIELEDIEEFNLNCNAIIPENTIKAVEFITNKLK